MGFQIKAMIPRLVKGIEVVLALIVTVAVIVYIVQSFGFFLDADWQNKETFYELIYRILLTTIGLELARMLVTHHFTSIIELLAFVVARKMLVPNLTTIDVFLGVVSFVIIVVTYRYVIRPIEKSADEDCLSSETNASSS